jgi:hypothetical protein
MKIYTLLTDSHKNFFDEFFLPSYRIINKDKKFSLCVGESKQICKNGEYGEVGFRETMADKVRMLINAVEENKGDFIIYADVDVQFFDGFQNDIFTYNDKNVDVYAQNDTPKCPENVILCAGFMIINCNEKMLNIFKETLSIIHYFEHDQYAFNYLKNKVNWKILPEDKYYTIAYNTGNDVWKGEKYTNVPKNILMHHGNWVKGIENKINLLRYIKSEITGTTIS